jgi:hypothetical protein
MTTSDGANARCRASNASRPAGSASGNTFIGRQLSAYRVFDDMSLCYGSSISLSMFMYCLYSIYVLKNSKAFFQFGVMDVHSNHVGFSMLHKFSL